MHTRNARPIPILVYHQIAPAPPKGAPFRSLYVAPQAFARQMAWLKRLGYHGLSMAALQPYLRGEKSAKVVGITFDDGYLNNLTQALPVLQAHGFSSTCYVVDGLLGQTNLWDKEQGIAQTPLMDAAQLRQWVAGGQEVGAHTSHHVDLTAVDSVRARSEIGAARQQLAQVLGAGGATDAGPENMMAFCYPYGKYQPVHVEQVAASGYSTATTTARGRVKSGAPLLELPRIAVVRSTTLPIFWLKVATSYEDHRAVV